MLVSVAFAAMRAKVKWLQVMTGNGEQAEAARSASGGTPLRHFNQQQRCKLFLPQNHSPNHRFWGRTAVLSSSYPSGGIRVKHTSLLACATWKFPLEIGVFAL